MSTEDRIRTIGFAILNHLVTKNVLDANTININDIIDFECTLISGTLTFRIDFLIKNYSGKSMQKKDLLEISNNMFDMRIYGWFLESINDILRKNNVDNLSINRYNSMQSIDYRFSNGRWVEEFPF